MKNYWDKWDVIIGKIKELEDYQITFIIRYKLLNINKLIFNSLSDDQYGKSECF